MKNKILIVDDHPILRQGLSRIIQGEKDLTVCGEAADGKEALKLIESVKPDLAMIDIAMDGMNGIDLIAAIRKKNSKIFLLVLSTHRESLYAERALRAGANGYIMKRESTPRLLSAIRSVLSGKAYLSDEINQGIIQKVRNPDLQSSADPYLSLTARELEVFRLIGQGFGTRQIANELHMSIKTVEAHREHIRAKYGMDSNYLLVQKAILWVHQESLLNKA